jgi:hypothetical protein
MITFDRLQQIIPADQALANKALSVALGQVNGISNVPLPIFAQATRALETTRDLPLITTLTSAVPASVANYYTSTLAVGAGPNGDIRVVDVIGLAAGWIATDAFLRTVEIFATMNLTVLTLIYNTMVNALNGSYGPTDSGPLIIPAGRPCAGTYNGVFFSTLNPDPPPPSFDGYDPTAIQLAMACLTGAATAEIGNLQTTYPDQTTELNALWTSMAEQVVLERTLQPIVNLNYADLTANDRNSIYGFIFSLPQYGNETEEGGISWFLEAMADLTTLGGEAIVASLREGRNQVALTSTGIFTTSQIPSDPVPPPPEAELLPSVYTEDEAINLVIK